MNPFAILCFVLDVLLTSDETHPMQPVKDENLVLACYAPPVNIPQQDTIACLFAMQDDRLITVSSEGYILLTQKGRVNAQRARFLNILAMQDPTLN